MILEKQDLEVWKDVTGFEGLYKISSKGNILSLERTAIHTSKTGEKGIRKVNEKIKKPFKTSRGYLVVQLHSDKSYKFSVHRLVALHFLCNPENKPEVNHINCNKECNEIWNLEWVSKEENENHALQKGKKQFKGNQYKKLKNKI